MFGLAKKLVSSLNGATENSDSRLGLRVLNIKEPSFLDVESFFDFIIACNGVEITQYLDINTQTGAVDLTNWINYMNHEANASNNDINLTVYSGKGGVERTLVIKASQFHEQNGLGISVQLTPLKASHYVWHILSVQPKSPAYIAGILPDEYVLQCEGGLLATGGEELLSKVIQTQYVKNNYQPVELVLYVYNYEADCVRPVRVSIREDWGGRGLLGCDIGYGLLHRVPEKFRIDHDGSIQIETPLSQPPQYLEVQNHLSAPSFENNDNTPNSTDSLQALTKVVQQPPSRARKHKTKQVPNSAINDYMKEQSDLRRAVDGKSPSIQGSVPPPPPPPPKKG